jgi:hypothetical protein
VRLIERCKRGCMIWEWIYIWAAFVRSLGYKGRAVGFYIVLDRGSFG